MTTRQLFCISHETYSALLIAHTSRKDEGDIRQIFQEPGRDRPQPEGRPQHPREGRRRQEAGEGAGTDFKSSLQSDS